MTIQLLTDDAIDDLPCPAARIEARRVRRQHEERALRYANQVTGWDGETGTPTHPLLLDALPHGVVRRLQDGAYPWSGVEERPE